LLIHRSSLTRAGRVAKLSALRFCFFRVKAEATGETESDERGGAARDYRTVTS
jgi:hypothetical protein